MKRYLLFLCKNYYPSGGWEDFHESYDTLLEALSAGRMFVHCEDEMAKFHVVDRETWEIVHKG